MRNFCCILMLMLWSISGTEAQKLPATNVLLFNMQQLNDSVFLFNTPRLLTDFNKDGYNNQPFFMSDNELYLTVQMADDTTQTDIYAMDIRERKLTRITRTIESEFSPTLVPPVDDEKMQAFSCVRVERDAAQTQRLWQFPLDRSNRGTPAFKTIKNVGYYEWLSATKVALFIVGNPHQLIVADTRSEQAVTVVSNIGRCLQKMGRSELAFVDKSNPDKWILRKLDIRFYRTEEIIPTLPGAEDFVILPDGTFLMSSDTRIFKFHPKKDTEWREVGNFSYYGFDTISRMAITDGKIAFVFQ